MTTLLCLGTDEGVVAVKGSHGTSWEIESRALQDWSVSEVAVDPAAPEVIYAGTRGDGVWRSDDRGHAWTKPSYGKRAPGKVQCLAFDPSDRRRLFAGGEPIDLFVTEDGGGSWQCLDAVWDHPFVGTITYPVLSVEPHVRDIAINPREPRTMYIALQVGYILKTTDGGATWTLLDQGIDSDVHTISINPQDPEKLLIATGGHDSRQGKSSGKALFRSSDAGQSWAPTAMEFSQEYSIPMVLHPTKPEVAFAALAHGYGRLWKRPSGAEGVIIRTRDGGVTWQQVGGEVPGIAQRMAVAIAIDDAEPSNVYAALDDGQLIASRDGGDAWTLLDVRTPPANDLKCVRL